MVRNETQRNAADDGGDTANNGGSDNDDAVARGDVDALTALVDRWCFDERWPLVVDLRDSCRLALQRGKQLWAPAAYAEYRLALDGPPSFAASVLGSAAERFTLGPFAEVMASTHTFVELTSHLPDSPEAGIVAHECAVRGDFVEHAKFADVLSLPLQLQAWEPVYPVARFEPGRAFFDAPILPTPLDAGAGKPKVANKDQTVVRVLSDLVSVWQSESNGRSEVVEVDGSASDAVATLGCIRHRIVGIDCSQGLAAMAWTAANGGAQGRRRGMAAGRQAAWWALHHLAGFSDTDVVEPDELGDAGQDLDWYLWDDGAPDTGWSLRLAIEDRAEGLAWAISAVDAAL